MTKWSHLPNAQHIDRVMASVRAEPEKWSAALDAAWGVDLDAAWDAAWSAALDAAWGVALDAAWGVAWRAARDALLALVAWDDCAYLLDLPVCAVRRIASTGNHAAILLLPAVIVFNGEET